MDLKKIKNTVSTILAVLVDAAEQQNHNHQVRDWLEKLKDAVYEADDLKSSRMQFMKQMTCWVSSPSKLYVEEL